MDELWTEKYKPRKLNEFIDQKKALEKFKVWLKKYIKGETRKAALLYGPSGTGKTTLVEVIANELGLEIVVIDQARIKDAGMLKEKLENTTKLGNLFSTKGRIVLIDEIESLYNLGAGVVNFIAKTINNSRYPIVLTTNDAYSPKLRVFREKCEMIPFKRLSKTSVLTILKRVVQLEKLKIDANLLKRISLNSNGDLRAALNDLQSLNEFKGEAARIDQRNIELDVFRAISKIIYSKKFIDALSAIEGADINYELMFRWLVENIDQVYSKPRELAEAMDKFSKADMYLGRIVKTGNWSLLKYVFDLMVGGSSFVNIEKPRKFIFYRFPSFIRKMSSQRGTREMEKNILLKVSRKCHVSSKKAYKEYLPFIKLISSYPSKIGDRLMAYLELDKSERSFLKKR